MEALGNLLHTVGEKVGLVAADEKKDEGIAAPAPANDAPADHEEKRGILSSIAEAAKTALAPPPLEVDPSTTEKVEPIAPPAAVAPEKTEEEKKEEKPATFLGGLLQKVEDKIEETLPYVAPIADKKVEVSAFGSVFDKDEEDAASTASGKVDTPDIPRAIGEAKPKENPLGTHLSAPMRADSAKGNTSVMAEWAGPEKDLNGIDKADLQRVQAEADKAMAQSAADRRTSVSVSSEPSNGAKKKKRTKSKKNKQQKAKEAEKPKVVVDGAILADILEKINSIDESKLPKLTPEIAFAAPAEVHSDRAHRDPLAPKHQIHDHAPTAHEVHQPRGSERMGHQA